jgi:hypothetical protein
MGQGTLVLQNNKNEYGGSEEEIHSFLPRHQMQVSVPGRFKAEVSPITGRIKGGAYYLQIATISNDQTNVHIYRHNLSSRCRPLVYCYTYSVIRPVLLPSR